MLLTIICIKLTFGNIDRSFLNFPSDINRINASVTPVAALIQRKSNGILTGVRCCICTRNSIIYAFKINARQGVLLTVICINLTFGNIDRSFLNFPSDIERICASVTPTVVFIQRKSNAIDSRIRRCICSRDSIIYAFKINARQGVFLAVICINLTFGNIDRLFLNFPSDINRINASVTPTVVRIQRKSNAIGSRIRRCICSRNGIIYAFKINACQGEFLAVIYIRLSFGTIHHLTEICVKSDIFIDRIRSVHLKRCRKLCVGKPTDKDVSFRRKLGRHYDLRALFQNYGFKQRQIPIGFKFDLCRVIGNRHVLSVGIYDVFQHVEVIIAVIIDLPIAVKRQGRDTAAEDRPNRAIKSRKSGGIEQLGFALAHDTADGSTARTVGSVDLRSRCREDTSCVRTCIITRETTRVRLSRNTAVNRSKRQRIADRTLGGLISDKSARITTSTDYFRACITVGNRFVVISNESTDVYVRGKVGGTVDINGDICVENVLCCT